MADLKQIPIQSDFEKRAVLVKELINLASSIQRGEIPADCFLLVTMATRCRPPLITPIDYNCSFAEVALMTDYAKLCNTENLYLEDE